MDGCAYRCGLLILATATIHGLRRTSVRSAMCLQCGAKSHALLPPGCTQNFRTRKTEVDQSPTRDLAAYDLYLRAREGPTLWENEAEVRRDSERKIAFAERGSYTRSILCTRLL